jgi:hypothetical protein
MLSIYSEQIRRQYIASQSRTFKLKASELFDIVKLCSTLPAEERGAHLNSALRLLERFTE